MNENINLVKILKDAPDGTKLWSPICGVCYFKEIRVGSCAPIVCTAMLVNGDYGKIYFTEEGIYFNKFTDGGCTLFPSRENHDWSTFKAPKKHKEFKPFQKVLVRVKKSGSNYIWIASIYSHYDISKGRHYLTNLAFADNDSWIIPFEGNEDKLGEIVE